MVMTQSAVARSKGQDALDRGTQLYQEGLYLEAAKAFHNATKLDPALIKAWENLGWAYYKSGQTKEALGIFETILKVEPDNMKIHDSMSYWFMEENQWRRAIPHLIASLKSAPDQNLVRLRLGKAYQKIGQTEFAIDQFKHALKIQSDNWEAQQYLADAYEASGRRASAITLYKKFWTSNSDFLTTEKNEWIAVKLSNLIARRGDELYRKNQFQKAEDAYKKALSWNPDNITLLQNLGWSLEKQGKYNEAVKTWLKIVDRGYTGFQLFHQIANVYYHSGQTEKAQIWYQNAAGMDSSNGSIQFRVFELAIKRKEITNGLKALKNVFAMQGADRVWSMRVANYFIRHATIIRGIEFFHERLSHSSNPETTKKVLGRLHSKLGSRHRKIGNARWAILNYEKALFYESGNTTTYRDLGWLYWRMGKRELCEKIWRQYQKKFSDKAEPYDLLARMYLKQKRYAKALLALKDSLNIHPDRPAQKLLQAKASYWDKRYSEAMQRMYRIVGDYPDLLPIQYFYGEVLIQQHDFKRGRLQWRKVLDLGEKKPRAYFYWVQSLFETGEYEMAIREAKNFLNQHGPYKPILKLLVNDALFRQDKEQAIFWYERLLKDFGGQRGDWLELAKLYAEMNHTNQATECLKEAERQFPDDVHVQVALGDLQFKEGKYEEALEDFRVVTRKNPDNQRAFRGTFHALKALGRRKEAIRYLRLSGRMFLKDYEFDLEMGNMMIAMKDLDAARSYYSRVATPGEPGQFVPILLYHGLSDHSRSRNLWVQHFDNQLKALADAGYTTVTVAELKEFMKQNLPLPVKPLLIIFDGESLDAFRLAGPLIKKYAMKATLFVPTVRIYEASPRFAGWGAVRHYEESGRWDIQIRNRAMSRAGRSQNGNLRRVSTNNSHKTAIKEQLEFFKDRTGYNWVKPGDAPISLLRGFAIPRNWDGDRLIQHLVEAHPSHAAKLALAKSHYWGGQVSDAEKIFSDLVAQEPWFKNKVQIYLANISYQGGNYWEAEKILQNIPAEEFNRKPKAEKLQEAVAWKNRSRVFGGFDFFHDSNERTNHSESARIYFPLKIPLELMLEGGSVNFEEAGRRDLHGNDVTAGVNWQAWKSLRLGGKFRNRYISQKHNSQSYWVSAEYSKNQHKVQFNGSKRDIDTVQAIDNGIQAQTYSLGYQTRISPLILGNVGLTYQEFDDGNSAFNIVTRLRYTLPELKNWKVGADLSYKDSDFEASAYYTPDQLLLGVARVFYQRQFGEDFDLKANYGLGGASDKVNGIRWVTNGGVNLDYRLTRQLKAGLTTKISVVPGYNSVNLKAFIGYRF